MTLVNVAIPVIRGRMLLTVDKGRPWSVIEHIILEALAEKAWITAELAVAGKLPRRIVVEACARLMRAGWAELLEDNRSVRFQATPRGRQVAQYEELPSVPERRRRTASYVIDLISNEIFRGRTWFVHDEQALKAREKTEPFVWIEAPSQEVDYDTTKLMELLLDDDETFVDAEPAGPLWRWAVVTVKDGVVDGFPPGRDLPVLRRAVLAAAATVTPETTGTEMTFSVSDAAVRRYADVPEVRAVSFDTTDLILGGKAHENAIKTSLAKARSKIFIHSTFIGDEQFLALLPNIADAVRRGVRVHVLWGQNEDAEGVASTKTAIAKLRQNKAVAELEPLLTIHPYSTRSHAKLILADAGKNGHYLAIIGSCNWFASRFLSYEMSVKLRDAVIVRDVAEYLARMSCMHGGVWSELATDLTSISQRLKKMRPRSTSNAHASLVIGAQHSHFVLRARDEAQHRVLVVSHKLGPVSSPSIRPGVRWPDTDVTIVDVGVLAREGYEDQLTVAYVGLMNHINDLVERHQHDARPTLVVTDEGHIITTNPLLAPYVVKITKMWRKLGTWFWIATQNLEDFPDQAKKMLNMMEWWLCLVMPKEEVEQIARFKDLTADQRTLLLSARKEPGKYTEGVVLADKVQALFRNVPPPLALALAMTEKHEKAERARLMRERGCSELEAVYAIAEELAKEKR